MVKQIFAAKAPNIFKGFNCYGKDTKTDDVLYYKKLALKYYWFLI